MFKMAVSDADGWQSLWDAEVFVPGDWVEGQQMRNGKKLKYKINGKSHHTTYLSPGAHFSL